MKNSLKEILDFLARHICEVVLIICLFSSFFRQVQNDKWKEIIRSDGFGYYSYLPAVFIYKDCKFSFIKDIQNKYKNYDFTFINETPKGKVNKYFIGLSLLWFPFFIVAHLLSLLLGLPTDGYSLLYQISVVAAANFYLWLGCRYLRKLILEYSDSQAFAAFITLLTVFATNLHYYATVDSWGTHPYSFSMIAIFLFCCHSFFKYQNIKNFYLAFFLLGLIVLLRPTDIVIALMALFFSGNFQTIWQVIRKFRFQVLTGFVLFLIILLPQFIFYWLQTAHLWIYSYGKEKFDFSRPEILNVLLSYQQGLFIYAPINLLALGGLYYLYRRNKFQFTVMLAFLFSSTYIISSWWIWTYGCCLGQRAFIDYSAVAALLISFLFLSVKSKNLKVFFYTVPILFIAYSFVVTYQHYNHINDWGNMNKQKFWFTFLKTGKEYEGVTQANVFFTGNAPINLIAIKASNNKYLCAEGGSDNIVANRDNSYAWETFKVINLENNKIALQCSDGKYISARLDQENVLMHNANEIKVWETFQLIRFDNRNVLVACNQKFITRSGEKLSANASNLGEAEFFLVVKK